MLPALVSRDDLLLLEAFHSYQTNDKKMARKQTLLVHQFHQTNYMATMGMLVGLCLTVLMICIGWNDLIHKTNDTLVTGIMVVAGLAVMLFCYLVRILGMWQLRRNLQKFKDQVEGQGQAAGH